VLKCECGTRIFRVIQRRDAPAASPNCTTTCRAMQFERMSNIDLSRLCTKLFNGATEAIDKALIESKLTAIEFLGGGRTADMQDRNREFEHSEAQLDGSVCCQAFSLVDTWRQTKKFVGHLESKSFRRRGCR